MAPARQGQPLEAAPAVLLALLPGLRTLALRTPVDRANQRFGNVCRISAKLLPKPAQPAPPPLLTIVGTKRPARRGKYG
jgi:hypothetical protein